MTTSKETSKETSDLGSSLFFSYFSSIKPHQRRGNGNEWQSHVLTHHGPIEELAPNLWHVSASPVNGTLPPREMVLYRLTDSTLLIHSAIALDEQGMAQLESLGTPEILVVPNRIHRTDAAVYKQRYPKLLVVCPAVAKEYVEEVVQVDAIAEEVLPTYGIVCHEPSGIRPLELVYELPLPTGKALVFADILFNLTESYLEQYVRSGRFIFRWLGVSGYFGITKAGEQFFMTNRDAYRQWLEELASRAQDVRVICVAHGSPIQKDCAQRLREAAERLLGEK